MSWFNDWGDPDPDHRYSYLNEPRRQRPYCGDCGEPLGPDHSHDGDGIQVCSEGHLHDIVLAGIPGNPPKGFHCPGDPDSPYHWRDE